MNELLREECSKLAKAEKEAKEVEEAEKVIVTSEDVGSVEDVLG